MKMTLNELLEAMSGEFFTNPFPSNWHFLTEEAKVEWARGAVTEAFERVAEEELIRCVESLASLVINMENSQEVLEWTG